MTEYFQYTIGNNEIKSKNFYGYIYLGIIFTDISFVIISALPNLLLIDNKDSRGNSNKQ